MYARKLTKSDLEQFGISEVTTTGKVFKHGKEIKPTIDNQGYFMHHIYDLDENGNRIKIYKSATAKPYEYTYKYRSIGLHRLMWAWYYGEVPQGMIVDHITNRHDRIEDYYLDNLQLLTPAQNVAKERDNWHVVELKCNLNQPRSHYENKLEKYTIAYEQAKKDKDAKAAHKYRCNVAQVRARLRYYDNHIEEHKAKLAANDSYDITATRKNLQANIDSARKYYKQVLEAYGKDDFYTKKLYGEWKLAIALKKSFEEKIKNSK